MNQEELYFDPHTQGTNITLVGCGGSGAQLARTIARIAYQRKTNYQTVPQLVFIDPDSVEHKNVGRQLFGPGDIGKNKAQVLAQRFSYAYGLDIVWHARPVQQSDLRDSYDKRAIVCGAVDNAAARQVIANSRPGIWIDMGNHHDSGQVVLGSYGVLDDFTTTEGFQTICTSNEGIRYLPYPHLVFPDLLEAEDTPAPGEDLSCAALVELGQQDLLINDFMAGIAGQYLYKLLFRQPITSFVTFVDIDTLSMRSLSITTDNLLAYLAPDENPA